MAEEEKKNIYQRLMQARIDFAKKKIQPSGYNAHLDFDYLELKDIIPVANKAMQDNGIMLITTFIEGACVGHVIDLLGKEEGIVFTIPLPDPTKDAERLKLNVVAMTGAQVTYLRRYMYMLVLDITINDEVDADGDETPVVKPAVKSTPKTEEKKAVSKPAPKAEEKPKVKVSVSASKKTPVAKREEIKKELTDSGAKADELQINSLKAIMLRWVAADPEAKKEATEILVRTNGFANCTKKEADELLTMITKKIDEKEG